MSEREQFEAWAKRTGACSKSIGFNKCLFPGSDVYDDPMLQGYWSAWQASREALKDEHEPVAYVTYKGYLLHAGDPKVAEYSDPIPLYMEPLPSPPAINHPIDTTPNQYDALGKGGER